MANCCFQVLAFQTEIPPSPLPIASHFPSGEKRTLTLLGPGPSRVLILRRDVASQTRRPLNSPTKTFPSGEKSAETGAPYRKPGLPKLSTSMGFSRFQTRAEPSQLPEIKNLPFGAYASADTRFR